MNRARLRGKPAEADQSSISERHARDQQTHRRDALARGVRRGSSVLVDGSAVHLNLRKYDTAKRTTPQATEVEYGRTASETH